MEPSAELREAVRIVIERMRTHPEDFYDNLNIDKNGRFTWIWGVVNAKTERYTDWGLTEAEIAALREGYATLMYHKFHDRVLESLLNEEKHDYMKDYMVAQGSSLKSSAISILQGINDPRGAFGSVTQK